MPPKLAKVADTALVVLAFVVGGLAVASYFRGSSGEGRSATEELAEIDGKLLPRFQIQYVGGRLDSLPTSNGPTLLYFFSTECAACRRNADSWNAVVDSLSGTVSAVAVSAETLEAVAAHYPDSARTFAVGVIAESDQASVVPAYRMWATPITYLVDQQGKLHLSVVGVFNSSAMDRIIRTARSLRSDLVD